MCLPPLETFVHGSVVVVVVVVVVALVVVLLAVVAFALASTWLSPAGIAICNELVNRCRQITWSSGTARGF